MDKDFTDSADQNSEKSSPPSGFAFNLCNLRNLCLCPFSKQDQTASRGTERVWTGSLVSRSSSSAVTGMLPTWFTSSAAA